MGRRAYSAAVLDETGTGRKTAQAKRRAAEVATLTGVAMRERADVRQDPTAHECFVRVKSLLSEIGKDDALYENAINDYATYFSQARTLDAAALEAESAKEKAEYIALSLKIKDRMRKIEDTNCMNINAAQRTAAQRAKAEDRIDPLLEALSIT